MKVILNTPYLTDEYRKKLPEDHPFKKLEILNEFNEKIWFTYNRLNSNIANRLPNYFTFVLQSYFRELHEIEARYICDALIELDNITTEFLQRQKEKEEYKQKAIESIKRH